VWLFHFFGLRIAVYYAQISTKSQASRKSRADLEVTVFRKIYFIFAYAETIIKRFSEGVIYRPVLHLQAIVYLFSVRYCEIVLADRLHCKKFLWFVFASILQSDHYGKSMHRTITAISHCQHSHNVIHSFRSSANQKTFCYLIFA